MLWQPPDKMAGENKAVMRTAHEHERLRRGRPNGRFSRGRTSHAACTGALAYSPSCRGQQVWYQQPRERVRRHDVGTHPP